MKCLASKLAVEKLPSESCPLRRAHLITAQELIFSLWVSFFIWVTVCLSDFTQIYLGKELSYKYCL